MKSIYFNHEDQVIEVTSELVEIGGGNSHGTIENRWDVSKLGKISIILKYIGPEKKSLGLVKIVKALTGWGLKESKEAIDPIHYSKLEELKEVEIEIYDIPEVTIDMIDKMLREYGYSASVSGLGKLRTDTLEEMINFMSDKCNPYDHHTGEKAYWTYQDCLNIISKADNEDIIKLAKSIFDRWKHFTCYERK